MNISKAQLDFITSGLIEKYGEVITPEINKNAMDDILQGIAQGICDVLRDSATQKKVVTTSNLRSSIDTTGTTQSGDTISVGIVMDESWRWAEYGRKRGKRPPIESIEDWITRKGIKIKPVKGQSILQGRKSLAFAIAAKIGKKGTIKRFNYKGSRFIRDVVNEKNMRIVAQKLGELQGKNIELYLKSETGERITI